MELAKQSPEEILAAKLRALMDADEMIRKCKAALEEAEAERVLAAQELMPFFEESGVSALSLKSLGKQAYLYKQIWAGTADEATNMDVVNALKKSGLEHMVTYNHQAYSGWVRERAREAGLADTDGKITASVDEVLAILPKPFVKITRITEKIDIRVRKAK